MNLDGTKKACREIMSEPTGVLSWGRVASSVALVAAVIWISHLILKTGAMPSLDGITTFVLAPYGSNKLTTAVQSFSQKN